jgi:hypothetical protein
MGAKVSNSLFSLTEGDAALVMHVLHNYRDISGLNIVKAKKDILRTYTWLLEKSFESEALKRICLLRYFDILDQSALDKLFPTELDGIGLISSLCDLGMIIQPEWDTYRCSALLGLTLERLSYRICSTQEKQLQEELAVNHLRKTGQWEKALKLVSSADNPIMLEEVLHEILSDIDILTYSIANEPWRIRDRAFNMTVAPHYFLHFSDGGVFTSEKFSIADMISLSIASDEWR